MLTKIFFGIIDQDELKKSQNYERGFWDFEEIFIKLNEPIGGEHGVFQYFSNNDDDFWATVTHNFTKNIKPNFNNIKNELIKIHSDFSTIADVIELITLDGGDLFDVKDEFHEVGNTLIEEEKGIGFQFINLENYGKEILELDNSIWIIEVLKYGEVNYKIKDKKLELTYESSDDLNLIERFSFSVLLTK